MLTDLIAARPEDADTIMTTLGHASVWPTLEAKNVDQVKLASLAFILRGKPVDARAVGAGVSSFTRVASGGDDGPWMFAVPDELVHDLVGLSDDQIRKAAITWAATDELKAERWSAEDAALLLNELCAFVASEIHEDRKLLLWICL